MRSLRAALEDAQAEHERITKLCIDAGVSLERMEKAREEGELIGRCFVRALTA
jgi:hypothetical protein